MGLSRAITAAAAVMVLPVTSLAGNVVIVEGPAAGVYPNVQSAVNAAVDGDILLVGPGTYPAFTIDGKGVSVFAAPGAQPTFAPPCLVRNVPAPLTVILSGLGSTGVGGVGLDALQLSSNAGHVRLQGCTWTGTGWSSPTSTWGDPGGDGVHVAGCSRVSINGCTFAGGQGRRSTLSGGEGGIGGAGIHVEASTVAIHDSRATGGRGGDGNWGGLGGRGLFASNGVVFAAGSVFKGGRGGDGGWGFTAGYGGGGGDGFETTSSSVRLLDNAYIRGPGGESPVFGTSPPGTAFDSPTATVYFEPRRELHGPAVASDAGPVALTFDGEPGDAAYLRVQRTAAWSYGPVAIGPWLVPSAPLSWIPPLGVVPGSGTLAAHYQPRDVGPSRTARVDFLQVVAIDAQGSRLLSSPLHVLVFDDAAGPDCNGNGVPDALDIATGASLDLDGNGIPDECP